jgi:TatD-related deoxyribonuclease
VASSLPITDNHLHIDLGHGLGPGEVARLFSKSGGTHLIVVNKMVQDWGLALRSIQDFRQATESFLGMVGKLNSDTSVRAFAVVGPHPAELAKLWETAGPKVAKLVFEECLRHSAEVVRAGRATAIGEVGRPHFPVSEELLEASNTLLDLALQLAADVGCAVQVHMESSTPAQFEELASRARHAGLNPAKVVKHFSPPLIGAGQQTGVFPSVIASKENILQALGQGDRFLMETDYMDELARPGAVLGPRTVPRVTRIMLQQGTLSERSAWRIHKSNVEATYGVDISL